MDYADSDSDGFFGPDAVFSHPLGDLCDLWDDGAAEVAQREELLDELVDEYGCDTEDVWEDMGGEDWGGEKDELA